MGCDADVVAQCGSSTVEKEVVISDFASQNIMYVWGVNAFKKTTGAGTTLTVAVTVRYDSNNNGQPESNDTPLPGATVTLDFSRIKTIDLTAILTSQAPISMYSLVPLQPM